MKGKGVESSNKYFKEEAVMARERFFRSLFSPPLPSSLSKSIIIRLKSEREREREREREWFKIHYSKKQTKKEAKKGKKI